MHVTLTGILFLVLFAACGGSVARPTHVPTKAQRPALPANATGEAEASATPAANQRALPAGATFADIVDAARALDDASLTQSSAQCLLTASEPIRLDADLMPGARPLPPAPSELAALVESEVGAPTVLSAWGRVPGTSQVTLVVFTTTTPAAHAGQAFALFITPRGLYLRGSGTLAQTHTQAMSLDALSVLLSQLPAAQSTVLYVSADASVTVSQVRDVLRSLPERFELALAVALPKGTRLPTEAGASTELMCPAGLPEPSAEDSEGSLETQVLRDALTPLHDAALACAQSTGGRAWLGGRVVLALRIGADGLVHQSCVSEDAIGEPLLRRCLTQSAHALAFPAPKPAGSVDIALPLQLEFNGPAKQRALCE